MSKEKKTAQPQGELTDNPKDKDPFRKKQQIAIGEGKEIKGKAILVQGRKSGMTNSNAIYSLLRAKGDLLRLKRKGGEL